MKKYNISLSQLEEKLKTFHNSEEIYKAFPDNLELASVGDSFLVFIYIKTGIAVIEWEYKFDNKKNDLVFKIEKVNMINQNYRMYMISWCQSYEIMNINNQNNEKIMYMSNEKIKKMKEILEHEKLRMLTKKK